MKMWYSKNMKKHLQRTKNKLLSAYYGHPGRDLKIICVTGTTGKSTVAHYVHDILDTAGYKVNALESGDSVRPSVLQKFLSDTWKSGAEFAIITASTKDLDNQVFAHLPIYAVVMTNCIPSGLTDMTNEDRLAARATLFKTAPEIVVLNTDDTHYAEFAKYEGAKATYTYGTQNRPDILITHSQLYRKGTEAVLTMNRTPITVASFVTGEPTVSYMACAVAMAAALKINTKDIVEGISLYEPEEK